MKSHYLLILLTMAWGMLSSGTPSKSHSSPPTHQCDNLQIENDDNDGCPYYVTPLAAYASSCSYQVITSLRTLVQASTTPHLFTRNDLDNAAGPTMYYVGARIEGANGNLFVYCGSPTNETEDDTGSCEGYDLILNYDDQTPNLPSGYGEVTIQN